MPDPNVGCEVAHGLVLLPPASYRIFHGAIRHPICSTLTRLSSLQLCLEYSFCFIYSYSSFTSQRDHVSSEEEASLGVCIASLLSFSLRALQAFFYL